VPKYLTVNVWDEQLALSKRARPHITHAINFAQNAPLSEQFATVALLRDSISRQAALSYDPQEFVKPGRMQSLLMGALKAHRYSDTMENFVTDCRRNIIDGLAATPNLLTALAHWKPILTGEKIKACSDFLQLIAESYNEKIPYAVENPFQLHTNKMGPSPAKDPFTGKFNFISEPVTMIKLPFEPKKGIRDYRMRDRDGKYIDGREIDLNARYDVNVSTMSDAFAQSGVETFAQLYRESLVVIEDGLTALAHDPRFAELRDDIDLYKAARDEMAFITPDMVAEHKEQFHVILRDRQEAAFAQGIKNVLETRSAEIQPPGPSVARSIVRFFI
jgi:hypothetical protein